MSDDPTQENFEPFHWSERRPPPQVDPILRQPKYRRKQSTASGCLSGCLRLVAIEFCLMVAAFIAGAFFLNPRRDTETQPDGQKLFAAPTVPTGKPIPSESSWVRDHLDDSDAARAKYTGTLVTAAGVVDSSQWHTNRSEGAFVMLVVEGGHTVVATFKWPREQEGLSLKSGRRATIKGRVISSVAGRDRKVVLMLTSCEIVD